MYGQLLDDGTGECVLAHVGQRRPIDHVIPIAGSLDS
jgi:hypothetical protein